MIGLSLKQMTKPKEADLAKAKVELRRLREIDAAAAMAEYHAAKAVDLQNMAQLKALRLAKEAADRDAASETRAWQASGRLLSSIRLTPEIPEAVGCQLGIAHRVLDILMTEIGLQGARVVPRIGQRIAATVSQHVRMDRKWHLGTGANAAEQGMECLGRRGFCFFRRRGALDIRRDCEPGKGSVFTVRLPASSDRNDGLRKPERKNSHLAARSDNLLDSYGDDLRQSATASQRTSSKQLDQNESRQHRGYHVARRPVHSRAVSVLRS